MFFYTSDLDFLYFKAGENSFKDINMVDTVHLACKGKWKCTKNEQFDEYLGKHGIGYITRKLVNAVPCTLEIVQNEDGTWTVREITPVRTSTNTYEINVRWIPAVRLFCPNLRHQTCFVWPFIAKACSEFHNHELRDNLSYDYVQLLKLSNSKMQTRYHSPGDTTGHHGFDNWRRW